MYVLCLCQWHSSQLSDCVSIVQDVMALNWTHSTMYDRTVNIWSMKKSGTSDEIDGRDLWEMAMSLIQAIHMKIKTRKLPWILRKASDSSRFYRSKVIYSPIGRKHDWRFELFTHVEQKNKKKHQLNQIPYEKVYSNRVWSIDVRRFYAAIRTHLYSN